MKNEVSIIKLEKSCEDVAQILKVLSHPTRLMILAHLLSGKKTVNELVALCEVSQSQMSQFLIRMKSDGIIDSEKEGTYSYYSLTDRRLFKLMKTIQSEFCAH